MYLGLRIEIASFVVIGHVGRLSLDFIEFLLLQEKSDFMFSLKNLTEDLSVLGFSSENHEFLTILLGIEEQ